MGVCKTQDGGGGYKTNSEMYKTKGEVCNTHGRGHEIERNCISQLGVYTTEGVHNATRGVQDREALDATSLCIT